MKSALLAIAIILCCHYSLQAQGEGNVWAFGMYAGLDFNSGSPVPIQTAIDGFGEGNASVCSKTGQLLFYTEGSIVWDRDGNIMSNGNNLTGLPNALSGGAITPTASCSQGAVIMPIPDSAGKYYIFSLTETEEGANAGRLYYSVVDMALNGGLGDIEPARKGIVMDSALTEKMTAVVGDHCDVWLLVHSIQSASFKAYEITDAGINFTPIVSNAGAFSAGAYQVGLMKVSPNKKKIAVANTFSGLELCSFDAATGTVSNAIKLDNGSFYGAAFSPDNSKLYAGDYVNSVTDQFDVSSSVAATISASKTAINTNGDFYDIKSAPDGKLYDGDGGVIGSPNVAGIGCNYQTASYQLVLGTDFGHGLPNIVAVLVKDTSSPTRQAVTVCFKDSTTLYANDSGWNYMWDDGSIETYRTVYHSGNYVVHYYTIPCTYHTDTFAVNFGSLIPLTGSLSGCYGEGNGRVWVLPQAGDVTTYTYTWTDTFGRMLQPAVTSSIIADTLYNQYPGTYVVTLHGNNGCDTSIRVIIDSPAYAGFIHASDTGMCPHDTVTLHAIGGVTYRWQPDNRTYISDTTIADPRVSPQTDWSYMVYGDNASGCPDTAVAHVRVYPAATIQLPDSVTLYYGESFQFNPQTNCLNFSWFPPLGLSADNISNPIALPPVDTKYIVTGTTQESCTVKDSVNVYRSDDVILTLPNAFTPGNDPNNFFMPIYKGDVTLDYLRIFNRWGQMVYESNNLNQGWDGSWHGEPQTAGVFIYTIQGRTSTGRVLTKQGNVTLIR